MTRKRTLYNLVDDLDRVYFKLKKREGIPDKLLVQIEKLSNEISLYIRANKRDKLQIIPELTDDDILAFNRKILFSLKAGVVFDIYNEYYKY